MRLGLGFRSEGGPPGFSPNNTVCVVEYEGVCIAAELACVAVWRVSGMEVHLDLLGISRSAVICPSISIYFLIKKSISPSQSARHICPGAQQQSYPASLIAL